ncbi:MAG: hypothetical protein KGI08_10640 [Thaumarchaeota archaeon]|nr:hypothetical protein [Nitrososphaerota archaeon]
MGKAERQAARRGGNKWISDHKGGFNRCFKVPEGMSVFVPKPGIYNLDMMTFIAGAGNPYADEGVEHCERTYWAHANIGPNEDRVVCLAKTVGQKCAVCEWLRRAGNSPTADEETLGRMAAKERQLWLPYDHAEPDKGVQIMDLSYHLFGKRLRERIADDAGASGWEYFYDMAEGSVLRVAFANKSIGKGNPFVEARNIDFMQRKRPYAADTAKDMPCLDDLLVILTYDKMKEILLQTGDNDTATDDDETGPTRPARGPRPKPAVADDAPFDGDDDDTPAPAPKPGKWPRPAPVEEEEEEPAPAPKPKAGAKKPAAKPAPVDDDDDWDDDMPEAPAPKPAKPAAKKPRPAPAEEQEDEEEPAPPPKRGTKPKPAPAVADDDDDWDVE